jgi:flagellar hook-associated protein 2
MFGPIQFGGLASGLDTSAIIDALVGAQRRPIQLLEAEKAEEKAKLDELGSLEKLVDTLRDKAKDLSSLSGFLAHKVTASEEGAIDFTLSGDAPAGSHEISVVSLAKADSLAFDAQADADTTELGAGTISFDYDGTSYSIDISQAASTLNGIASAINGESEGEVEASVVNVGTEQTPSYRLVLSGQDTGTDFAVQNLSVTGTALGTQEALTTASNAEVTVNGLSVQRSGNLFDGVLDGISMSIVGAQEGETISFSVEPDVEGVQANLQEFVDAYNEVIGFIDDQSDYDEDSGAGGELFGDSVLQTLRRTLQRALFNVDTAVVQADTEGYSTLGLIGVDVDTDGRLSIDEDELSSKLTGDLDAFADLFVDTDGFDNGGAAEGTLDYYVDTTTDSGLFETMWREIDRIVDSTVSTGGDTLKGLFGRRKDTFNANISRADDQIEALEGRLERFEADLIQRYAALEETMASLNAQQSYVAGIFSAGQ